MAKARLSLESLSSRALPSASLVNGILTVDGTEGRDVIVVRQFGDRLSVRGQTIDVNGTPMPFVSAATVSRVDVNALGGNDSIFLGSVRPATSVDAGAGNDAVSGGRGDDTLNGGAGDDRLTGNGGNDHLMGETGEDRLTGNAGDDRLSGDDGNDTISGGSDDDVLMGEAGDDRLIGNAGDDSIDGNAGADFMFGGSGDDSMFGGSGDDHGSGDSGNDTLFGDDGNDTLSGGGNDDLLLGQAGDDRLNGNSGSDDVQGGLGDDDVRNDDHGGSSTRTSVEGMITAIDLAASKVTIRTATGATIEVIATASTIIQRNDAHTTLDTFQIGDPCEAKFDAVGNTVKIEAGVEDNQQDRVEGTITAIDLAGSTVTVQRLSGQIVVITVAPTTEIERNDESTTLAAFRIGDFCESRFDSQGVTLKIEALGV
jgi:Ca2+-binding RTX toxin-like protein